MIDFTSRAERISLRERLRAKLRSSHSRWQPRRPISGGIEFKENRGEIVEQRDGRFYAHDDQGNGRWGRTTAEARVNLREARP
jgi:hypothetical protein